MPTDLLEYKSGRERWSAHRPLTHSLDSSKEGLAMKATQSPKLCTVEGCKSSHHARSMCSAHYARWRRLGGVTRPNLPDAERFWLKVDKSGDCWEWTAAAWGLGYGAFHANGNQVLAHRWSYEHEVGPIPKGLHVDHICGNRKCVRPHHLRLATPGQNLQNLHNLSRNTSGYRGVSRYRKGWQVHLQHQGKQYWKSGFLTAEDADEYAVALRNKLFTHNNKDRGGDK